ncbi:MAG: histidinol-phosphatase HisJ family protein [Oscillospiraceae bacterium]|nr:histidinol-phosphatase HisJ family protein [Oscillospiraceae bacterium]
MIDCHTHTRNSPDGTDTPENGALRAIQLGLKAYAVTEHCEANRLYGPETAKISYNDEHYFNNLELFEHSMAENLKIKEKYSDTLNFINGIELGQATHNFEDAQKIVCDERLDYIIGSVHELELKQDFAFLDYSKEDIPMLLSQYFSEIKKLCEWGRFDVLGHLTYPLRYIEGEAGIKTDLSVYDELIADCFRLMSEKGIGLEINTSGLRQSYKKTFPELYYINMFRECKGQIITLGSDAHCTADIGSSIKYGTDLLRAAGFDKVYYFKNRKPYGMKI